MKLKAARDKRVAHYDEIKEPFDLRVSELKSLIDLCQDVFNKIYFALSFKSVLWEFSESDMVFSLTSDLNKYNKIRNVVYSNHSDQNTNIETEQLIKLIRASS